LEKKEEKEYINDNNNDNIIEDNEKVKENIMDYFPLSIKIKETNIIKFLVMAEKNQKDFIKNTK